MAFLVALASDCVAPFVVPRRNATRSFFDLALFHREPEGLARAFHNPHGPQGADPPLADASDAGGGATGGVAGRAARREEGRAVVLPLSAAALVACAVVLLLLAGGSAARRGQFVGADPTVLPSRGGGVGDLHLSQSKSNDGKKMKMVCLTVSIFFSVGVHSITPL